MDEAAIPRFARGTKFRRDEVRDNWVVLAPERMFVPDEHAAEILRLVDGARSVGAIADDLCARFAAPRDVILPDVEAMLRHLAERGVVEV